MVHTVRPLASLECARLLSLLSSSSSIGPDATDWWCFDLLEREVLDACMRVSCWIRHLFAAKEVPRPAHAEIAGRGHQKLIQDSSYNVHTKYIIHTHDERTTNRS